MHVSKILKTTYNVVVQPERMLVLALADSMSHSIDAAIFGPVRRAMRLPLASLSNTFDMMRHVSALTYQGLVLHQVTEACH